MLVLQAHPLLLAMPELRANLQRLRSNSGSPTRRSQILASTLLRLLPDGEPSTNTPPCDYLELSSLRIFERVLIRNCN